MTDKRTVLVSGSSGGIGESIVSRYLSEGWNVIALDRISRWSSFREDASVREYLCDLKDLESLVDISAELVPDLKINAMVNVVGKYASGDIFTETGERFEEVIMDNVMTVFSVTKAFIPRMTRGASIVNVSSVNGWFPQKNSLAYDTSKGATISMTRSLARDLGKEGIRANCVALGSVDTPPFRKHITKEAEKKGVMGEEILREIEGRTVLDQIINPEDVSDMIMFLTSNDKLPVTGAVFVMDGGLTIRNDV